MKKIILLFIVPALIICLIYFILLRGASKQEVDHTEITKNRIIEVEHALAEFKKDCDRLPTEEEGLEALIDAMKLKTKCYNYKHKGYLNQTPTDAWSIPLNYKVDGNIVILTSLGVDQKPGGVGQNKDVRLSIEF